MFVDELRRIVARHGARPAVVVDGRVAMTYRDLWARAAEIAKKLRDLGAGPESRVALMRPKSAEYVAALVGIWRAGAAFVPVDPSLPKDRIEFMIRNSGAKYRVLADATVFKSGNYDLLHQCNKSVSSSLAYVVYTSGSTGRPKGVEVTHRGIVPLLKSQIRAFRIGPRSRLFWVLSPSFDASISDLGTALLAGAAIHIESSPRIQEVLRRRRITHLDLPPSMLHLLDPERLPDLETLILGGEVASPAVVRRWARRARVVNVYGPTEATICTSLCVCGVDWDRPLLGRPLPGVEYRILDDELLIGGRALARGYANLPELTAERFVRIGGTRYYRTGDRVVRRADGEYEFRGRLDRQIKIRGLRIEPGEIEAALRTHGEVGQAAVVKRAEELAAFVVPANGAPPRPRELRAHLARTLPRWMLPNRIEVVREIPRLPNGKTDLVALTRSPDRRDPASPAAVLREIWARTLRVPSVGLHDDFFERGGDSLRALEMVVAAEERGIAIAPSWIAEGVTIAKLLHRLRRRRTPVESMSAAELRRDIAWDRTWKRRLDRAAQRPAAIEGPPKQIFLTGSTGFLGSRVLEELLKRTDAGIICLVRNVSRHPRYSTPRISQVVGDLDAARLGLDPQTWGRIVSEVDTIYHCAARVHLTAPYAELRRTNVEGTREIVRLMCEGPRKRLHYASTLSVFVATDRHRGTMRENDDLGRTRRVYGGYAQSKWAAEILLRSASRAAGPVTHYRFGLLTGDTKTGLGAPSDLLTMFVNGTASAGCIPAGVGRRLKVDLTPVDYAAAAMVEASLRNGRGDTVHIANPKSLRLDELIAALRRAGIPVEEVPLDVWRARAAGNESAAYLALCRPLDAYDRLRTLDLFQATDARFDGAEALRRLRGTGLRCPAPDSKLLSSYLASMLR